MGKRRRVTFEVYDTSTIVDFVAHGLGVALATEFAAASRPDLRAIPLADVDMTWTFAVIVHRRHATPVAQAFPALIQQEFGLQVADTNGGRVSR
jgi:DNA-binding transcriptional LysR family regulator